jgi:type IX secretion system PorP/SprF family membrane protein
MPFYMKRVILVLVFFVAVIKTASAQQLPQYTQYVFNNFLLNPAVAGIENYTDAKLGYRTQWTGLTGAPVTSFLTVNAPLGTDFTEGDAASFGSGSDNPSSRLYTQNYQAAAPHHGIGFSVVNDKAGPIQQTNIAGTYAYHLGLAPRLNMALGVSVGMNHTILNTSEVVTANPFDPAIANGNNSQWKPDIGAGVWLYSAGFYVGASVQQLLTQNLYFSTTTTAVNVSKTVPHFFATAGTKLYVSDDITLLPSILLKEIQPVPLTFDLNLKASFQDKFWIGGSYRRNDSFAALAGFNLSSFINVGYAYDATTSSLNTVSNGTHEIIISLLLNNRYHVTCPQRNF